MKREEAKAIIEALVTLRESATDEQALAAPAIYPAWREGVAYVTGVRVLQNGVLYKVLQDHTSQTDWNPEAAPSLFAKVLIPDANVIYEWEPPSAENPYMTGDKVTHNGQTWVSLIDNNVWEPTEANATLWQVVTE